MVTTRRSIASGETFSVSGSTTNDASTYDNAGTLSNQGTTQAAVSDTTSTDIDTTTSTLSRTRALVATGTDIDATSAVLTRIRALTTLDTDVESIDSGDTLTVNSGETLDASTIENAGTLSNQGTTQTQDPVRTFDGDDASTQLTRERSLITTASDIDVSTAIANRVRALVASATDVDAAPIQLTRLRALTSTATDIDAADSTLFRERSLVAAGVDVDTAIAPLFVVRFIESTRAVEAVEEVLDTPNGHWRHEEPDVQFYWESAQSERGNGADQPGDVYVWSPTGETHERFSLDNDAGLTDDSTDIEILVYSLDEFEVMEYAEDIALLLEEYFDDNKDLTNFTTIEPVATRDYREQTNHRATDHYVAGVEVELRTLSPATRRG